MTLLFFKARFVLSVKRNDKQRNKIRRQKRFVADFLKHEAIDYNKNLNVRTTRSPTRDKNLYINMPDKRIVSYRMRNIYRINTYPSAKRLLQRRCVWSSSLSVPLQSFIDITEQRRLRVLEPRSCHYREKPL